jgi:putative transposase
VREVCRKLQVTESTFFRWKRTYGNLGVSELRELKQLQEENRRLKRVVTDLTLDKDILQEALRKKWSARFKGDTRWRGHGRSTGSPSVGRAG